jgi:hypothetical protein
MKVRPHTMQRLADVVRTHKVSRERFLSLERDTPDLAVLPEDTADATRTGRLRARGTFLLAAARPYMHKLLVFRRCQVYRPLHVMRSDTGEFENSKTEKVREIR